MNSDFFSLAYDAIRSTGVQEKCERVAHLAATTHDFYRVKDSAAKKIPTPGLPRGLTLVPPRELERRRMSSQQGRNRLMHAIAHIEFNAINLALDAAYRFRGQPQDYYLDWINVAADEARHFSLIQEYLHMNDCDYGAFPAHNGLWEMAVDTDHDVLARMALVPRVLEARGLDVTPSMIKKLEGAGDSHAAEILTVIYNDEIGHVGIGSKWFRYHCEQRDLEPESAFRQLVATYLHGELRGPYNKEARVAAGFTLEELNRLETK